MINIYVHYDPLQIHYNPLQIHYKLTTLTTNSLQIHYKLTTTHYKLTTLENVVSGVSRKLNGRSPMSFSFLRNVYMGLLSKGNIRNLPGNSIFFDHRPRTYLCNYKQLTFSREPMQKTMMLSWRMRGHLLLLFYCQNVCGQR